MRSRPRSLETGRAAAVFDDRALKSCRTGCSFAAAASELRFRGSRLEARGSRLSLTAETLLANGIESDASKSELVETVGHIIDLRMEDDDALLQKTRHLGNGEPEPAVHAPARNANVDAH